MCAYNRFHQQPASFHPFVILQGEQLCGIRQLQVFHAVFVVLATVLPFYNCYGSSVLHQVLDCKYEAIMV